MNLHHKDPTRRWSVFPRDIILTSSSYHGAYPKLTSPGYVSVQDTDFLQQGMEKLIKNGLDKYKMKVPITDLVTEKDIIAVFGSNKMADGRTVLEWWKQGSTTGVKPTLPFSERLKSFNERVAYLAGNGQDYEKLINYIYPNLGPNWILQGKSQIDVYLFMSRHPAARTQLPLYFDIDDRDYINDKWGTWINF